MISEKDDSMIADPTPGAKPPGYFYEPPLKRGYRASSRCLFVYLDLLMAHTYTEIYYHFVWATKNRHPLIVSYIEEELYRFINHKCDEKNITLYAVNGMADHFHLACSLPPRLSISEFMEFIKGTSSYFVNHMPQQDIILYWQEGYGALTFSKRDLTRVVDYIQNQKRHHNKGSLLSRLERIST